jgi:hypothetical protein
MSRPDDGGDDPYHASTNFEDFSHAQMLDMIQNGDPAKVTALAHKLDAVATKTEKIGTDLQTHMSKVEWHGPAGDAFREWGSRVAGATLTLSDYSSNAGVFMLNAGQVLSEVQRDMPKVPSNAYHTVVAYRTSKNIQGPFPDTLGVTPDHLDGVYGPYTTNPSPAQYKAATTALENARSSAVDQMNKLGQAYNMATDVISTSQEPTFPPAPQTIMPARPDNIDGTGQYVPGSTGGSGTYGGSSGKDGTTRIPQQHFSVPGNKDFTPTKVPGAPLPAGPGDALKPVQLPPDPGLHLDSLGPVPTQPVPAPPALPTGPAPVPQPGPGGTPLPLPMPPGLGRFPGDLSPSGLGPGGIKVPVGDVPPFDAKSLAANPTGFPQETEVLPENASGYGPLGGRMPVPGMGGMPASATSGLPVPGMGGAPGGRTGSTITGGRQRVGGVEGEEGEVPRGTVIGGVGGAGGGTGRSGLYPTSYGTAGEQSHERGERRRRTAEEEPEGVIGGTPTRDARRVRRNVRSFTAGGAGLARNDDEPTDGESRDTPPHGREQRREPDSHGPLTGS